jgi:PKD repeat protein
VQLETLGHLGDDGQVQLKFKPAREVETVNGKLAYDLVVSGVSGGLNAYEMKISVDDPSVAKITDLTFVNYGGQYSRLELLDDGSAVYFEEAVGDASTPDEEFTLARITMSPGDTKGTTALTVEEKTELQADDFSYYHTLGGESLIAVVPPLPDITDNGKRVKDPDDDGLYEDVDGDGEVDIFDVQTLFEKRDSQVVQDHVELFDFDNSGSVDIFDVQKLFKQI